MPHHEDNDFSAPATTLDFSALLFDMDGTIIDSTPAIVKYWHETGREIGVDGDGTCGSPPPSIAPTMSNRPLTHSQ